MIQNMLMQQALQQPKPGDIKQIRQGEDFVTVRIDPRTGQMTEIGRSPIAASRPQTNINLPSAQKKFTEGVAKTANKRIDDALDAGGNASVVNQSLDMFEQAMGQAEGGGLAEVKLGLGRVAQSLGIDPESFGLQNVASLEAAQAISNRLALAQVEQMKGALSNKELGFLQSQIPQISNTPEGRQKLIGILRAANKRAIDRADFVTQWISDNPNASGGEFLSAIRDYDKGQPALEKEIKVASQPTRIRVDAQGNIIQ